MSRFNIFTIIAIAILAGGLVMLGVLQLQTTQSLDQLEGSKIDLEVDLPLNSLKEATTERVGEEEVLESKTTEAEEIVNLQASISALIERIDELEKNSSSGTTTAVAPASSTFQKETLYLGSATSTNRDWTNSGLEVIIDSSDYPSTVSISFEAGLSIIGGEASARITNKTTGAIISSTEISNGTNETIWRTSASFKPHHGKNTYVVQIRSSSGEVANMTGARLVVK